MAIVNKRFSDKSNVKVLDAGCGTGGLIDELKNDFDCYGIDISDVAIKFCKDRKLENISKASIEKTPFTDNVFDVVISIDVLYHLLVTDETTALREFYRIMYDKGILIINLPAFEFLRSGHDHIVHGRRRYLKKDLEGMIKRAGFSIIKITYRNTIFFPLVCIVRLFNVLMKNQPGSDLKALPGWLNSALIKFLMIENQFLKHFNLPFGLSIFCVAKKEK